MEVLSCDGMMQIVQRRLQRQQQDRCSSSSSSSRIAGQFGLMVRGDSISAGITQVSHLVWAIIRLSQWAVSLVDRDNESKINFTIGSIKAFHYQRKRDCNGNWNFFFLNYLWLIASSSFNPLRITTFSFQVECSVEYAETSSQIIEDAVSHHLITSPV